MRVVFLGVGESTDENNPNTSILAESKSKLLLDCGFSVPRQLWKYNAEPDFLDAVFISHQHGDHILGLPGLLLRMWQDGRKKPLAVFCSRRTQKIIRSLLGTHYKNVLAKPRFYLAFHNAKYHRFNELQLEFAQSVHSTENFAARISAGGKSVCYSGDGMFNEATKKLYAGSDLVIHEAYTLNEKVEGHATIKDLVHLFKEAEIKKLALVHLRRDMRENKKAVLTFIKKSNLDIILPESMEKVKI